MASSLLEPGNCNIPIKPVETPDYEGSVLEPGNCGIPYSKYLQKENYLSEFKTDADKKKARDNLDILNNEEINIMINDKLKWEEA